MIKIITLITKFIIVTLVALLFASCNHMINIKSIEGSGHVTTEKRIVKGDFKSIEVSNAIDLVIEQSDKIEIIVEADDNLQKEITTKVENGVLIIACNYNSFNNIKSKKVTVKMPIIDQLEASGAATIKSINIIKGESIRLEASSAASINLNIESDAIYNESSSGSTIAINGKALKLEATASSGSTIDAKDLLVNEIKAHASSGSTINVHPIVSLDATASSGASINYNIIPKSIRKEAHSGGSIHQE
ncbi:head GIN domain-containing protein [Flavobacterium sp. LB1P71]|uniref:head GIN domain-containing protein n=1 Tax=unclassified Flavobacterium TaxID=196869 RepID=UPI003AAF1239